MHTMEYIFVYTRADTWGKVGYSPLSAWECRENISYVQILLKMLNLRLNIKKSRLFEILQNPIEQNPTSALYTYIYRGEYRISL